MLEIYDEEMLLAYQTESDYDDIIVTFSDPDIKELLPIEPPNFKILQKFYYEYDKFALINSMNVGFLRKISWSLYANCIDLIFFSDEPDTLLLQEYLTAYTQSKSRSHAVLNYWEELLNDFDFSLFTSLPDYDCDPDMLLIIKHSRLSEELMSIQKDINRWGAIKIDMFQ